MRKMLRVVEVAWIVIAVVSAITLIRSWGTFGRDFWIFFGFMILAIIMFFVRRRQRINYEKRLQEKAREEENS